MFTDRRQAGLLLARRLLEELPKDSTRAPLETVVVGLPRGGVPVASQLSAALGSPLDILVSKKIGAPGQPELAIGAVTSDGIVVVDEQLSMYMRAVGSYIEGEKRRLTELTRDLERRWTEQAGLKPRVNLAGKRVIVVDDGVATGATAVAALRSVALRGAAEIIMAAPVMSLEAYYRLKPECHLVTTLSTPGDFGSVGQYYQDFHQVEDSEVIDILRQSREALSASSGKSNISA